MIKVRIQTDFAKFPVSGTVAINPDDVKECIEDGDGRHTWIKLFCGRMYRTNVPIKELRDTIAAAMLEPSDKVPSDQICKTRAEREYEAMKNKRKKS